jgi:hypothetical protein
MSRKHINKNDQIAADHALAAKLQAEEKIPPMKNIKGDRVSMPKIHHAKPSHEHHAKPSHEHHAKPSHEHHAKPSHEHHAKPSRGQPAPKSQYELDLEFAMQLSLMDDNKAIAERGQKIQKSKEKSSAKVKEMVDYLSEGHGLNTMVIDLKDKLHKKTEKYVKSKSKGSTRDVYLKRLKSAAKAVNCFAVTRVDCEANGEEFQCDVIRFTNNKVLEFIISDEWNSVLVNKIGGQNVGKFPVWVLCAFLNSAKLRGKYPDPWIMYQFFEGFIDDPTNEDAMIQAFVNSEKLCLSVCDYKEGSEKEVSKTNYLPIGADGKPIRFQTTTVTIIRYYNDEGYSYMPSFSV